MIVDACAGPGGWDEGLRQHLAVNEPVVGIEWDAAACKTRAAAGHLTIRASVAEYPPAVFAGKASGLLFSPPCQAWSMAGKRLGLRDQARIFAHLDEVSAAGEWADYPREGWRDDRSPLVLEPLRWALAIRPEWIALEQVPNVLPLWEHIARVLRLFGYSAWAGVLSAEQYGVPQTRKRAVLVASRVRKVSMPAPTHALYVAPPEPDEDAGLFAPLEPQRIVRPCDRHLKPWTSMAEALGWGMTERPSVTVVGASMTGGRRGLDGGSGARETLRREMETGRWMVSAGTTGLGKPQPAQPAPAGVITGKGTAYWIDDLAHYGTTVADLRAVAFRNGPQVNATVRTLDEPASTVYCSRPGNLTWVHNRPATTVQGDARIGRPGHKDWESQFDHGAIRVTVEEAAVLQSFRPDYPWQGTSQQRYLQVGNACPPLFSAHVAHAASGIPWRSAAALVWSREVRPR